MSDITLYTYAVSQSSEKVRWALDSVGVSYREQRLTPFMHTSLTGDALLSGVPVLVADGQTIGDSTRILEWLETYRKPFSLIPSDPALRAQVMAAESRFDMTAMHLLRVVYRELLVRKDLALRLWSVDANPLQRFALRAGYPLIRKLMESGLDRSPMPYARSLRIVDRAIGELDRVAQSGQRFLVGGRFSVADITAAAMLSPLACPEEHPVYSRADYRREMAPVLAQWRDRPGLEWVRQMYRHRGLAAEMSADSKIVADELVAAA
ncbi:MAG: glutathione S-transferase family protein [Nevskiaceae bacterium]